MKKERNYTAKDIEELMLNNRKIRSLDEKISDSNNTEYSGGDCIIDLIADETTVYDEYQKKKIKEIYLECINTCLKPRDREIIKLRYGFDTYVTLSLEEIGNKYGLSRERIRQIEVRVLNKIKTYLNKKGIYSMEDLNGR